MWSQKGYEVLYMGTGSTQQFDMSHWILRVIALIIDSIIIGIVVWILLSFVLISLLFTGTFYDVWLGYGYTLIFPFALGILEVFYFAILDVAWGGTIGKRLLGLQVQMTNGSRVTLDKAFIRNISKIYWIFLLLDWIVAIATPGDDRRQKITDRMAGTTVVQKSQPFAAVSPPPAQPSQ
jgi:uncharacterized RDD family membrane protein YckC